MRWYGLGVGSFSPIMKDLSLTWQWISNLLLYQDATQLMGTESRTSLRQSYEISGLYSAILVSKSAFKHSYRVQFLPSRSCHLILPKAGLVAGILHSKTIIPGCICILIDDSRESALAGISHWKGNVET